MNHIAAILKKTIQVFGDARATTHAAAIAFFTIFSLAPLVAFAIELAGIFVGRAAAAGELTSVLGTVMGPEIAVYVNGLAKSVTEQSANATFTLITIGVLLVGASAVFSQLKMSLDDIWAAGSGTPSVSLKSGVVDTIRRRALAFVMILVLGAALILSVVLDFLLIHLGQILEIWWPEISAVQSYLSWLITPIVSFGTFTIMFKLLPETHPNWREVLVGAGLTTLLFTIGTAVIGYFLNASGTTSLYGAASSLIAILLWVYYSSWIVLFGAAFTRTYGEYLAEPATFAADPALHSD